MPCVASLFKLQGRLAAGEMSWMEECGKCVEQLATQICMQLRAVYNMYLYLYLFPPSI